MFNSGSGNNGDFEALARQYWGAWGDAMRQAGMGAVTPAPPPAAGGWQQAMDWWSQLLPKAPSQANDALGRFNQQARDWYGQMQQVAGQFAGRDSNASEVTEAWRQALGASGANPFPEMFKSMSGKGLHGLDDWIEQAKPFLESIQRDSQRWLHLPAFGQHREHQERLQALAQAQIDYQQRNQAFHRLMATCAQRAFEVFESKLAAREEPGRQITSARGLFDLWIDAAEEAYAEIAMSLEFREVSGALTNAQMRLRAGIQKEVELMGAQFGMPTRTEVDSAHRKIAELERSLRRAAATAEKSVSGTGGRSAVKARPEPVAEQEVTAKPARTTGKPAATQIAPSPASKPARRGARKAAAKKAAPGMAAAKKTAPRKAAAKKTAPRKAAAKKTSPRKVAAKKSAPRKAAARKRVPAAAAVKEKRVPAKRSNKSSAAASQATAKATAARTKTSARSGSGTASMSMKDWVASNKAGADPGAGPAPKRTPTGKKGARK